MVFFKHLSNMTLVASDPIDSPGCSSLYILYTSIACLDMYFFPLFFFYIIYFKPAIDASFGLGVLRSSGSESRINVLTLAESVSLILETSLYPISSCRCVSSGCRLSCDYVI